MGSQVIDSYLAPAEGEVVVRNYHCTSLSPVFRLIGTKIDGFLTVTNKRIVYFATGSSLFGIRGHSRQCSDVPIADVANIMLGNGTRFSLLLSLIHI